LNNDLFLKLIGYNPMQRWSEKMATWKRYVTTFTEIILFLTIGFFVTEWMLSRVYEAAGIAYLGNVGTVWFGFSFLSFCLFTLIRYFVLSNDSPLLKERITSHTFYIVLTLSIVGLVAPFITGKI